MSRQYMTLKDVELRYAKVFSRSTLYKLVERNEIPHRKLPGRRPILFLATELDLFDDESVVLEVTLLPNGGRKVAPRRS